jgi:XTP/dITP diphosphohydrolase
MTSPLHSNKLVLATHNQGKLREFRTLLEPKGWVLLGLKDLEIHKDHEETGDTFAENARLKALAYSGETDLPVLADDSGLEVFALDGRPGVLSARYGGPGTTDEERNRKLLQELRESGGNRECRFVCALALTLRGSVLIEVEGESRGEIAQEPRGESGFGYDPIFLLPGEGRTYAELGPAIKNQTSHRARAIDLLLSALDRLKQ